jgi:hypothetical protein
MMNMCSSFRKKYQATDPYGKRRHRYNYTFVYFNLQALRQDTEMKEQRKEIPLRMVWSHREGDGA